MREDSMISKRRHNVTNLRQLSRAAFFIPLAVAIFAPFENAVADQRVPQKYEPSATCDQGMLGKSVVLGEYSYRLTNEVLSPKNIQDSIKKLYGSNYRLAIWSDIKKELQNDQMRANFIASLGIPPQDNNYDCGNILIAPGDGHSDQRYHFMAYHQGKRPSEWLILDEIGGDDVHLGRWNHFGRALIKKKNDTNQNDISSAEGWAESINGRWKFEGSVKPFSNKIYTANFDPVAPVYIKMSGYCTKWEDSNPDVLVYDANGKMVAESTWPSCFEELSFQPVDRRPHKIVIRNKENRFKVGFELTVLNDTGLLESNEP